jgi:predicted acyltransferase
LLAILFGSCGVSAMMYDILHAVITSLKWCSLAYALSFVAIIFLIGYVLYRKRIFIKL